MWEWTVSNIITTGIIVTTIIGFYWRQTYDSQMFKDTLIDIKQDIKNLNQVVSKLAVQEQRLDNQGERLNRIDARIDQLREGKGYIRPDVN